MKLLPIALVVVLFLNLSTGRRTKTARESLNLDKEDHKNTLEQINSELVVDGPNRGKRGTKHHIHIVTPVKKLKNIKHIPAKVHYALEPEKNDEKNVHHTFEETHEHVDHKEEIKQETEVHHVSEQPHQEQIEYAEGHEEHIKIKHHHHHHHHNHVKTVVEKEPYPVEKIVHVPVEKVVHVPKPYPVEKVVEKIVHIPKPYPVEKIVEKIVKVPVEKIVHIPKPYPVEKIIEKPVTVEKRVEVKVPYPVEKIVRVPVPVEKIVEKIVHVPKPYPVEKIVNKIVHVPRPYPVYKPVPYPVEVKVPFPVEKHVPYTIEKKVPYPIKVEVDKQVTVEKKVPVYVQTPPKYGETVEHHHGYKYEAPTQHHHSPTRYGGSGEAEHHQIHTEHSHHSEGNIEQYDQYSHPSVSTANVVPNIGEQHPMHAQLMQQQIQNFGYHRQSHQEPQGAESSHRFVAIDTRRQGEVQNTPFRISIEDSEPQSQETAPLMATVESILTPMHLFQFGPIQYSTGEVMPMAH